MRIVLKHGNLFYIKTCEICCCEFLYQKNDVINCGGIQEINCPECNSIINADYIKYNDKKIIHETF